MILKRQIILNACNWCAYTESGKEGQLHTIARYQALFSSRVPCNKANPRARFKCSGEWYSELSSRICCIIFAWLIICLKGHWRIQKGKVNFQVLVYHEMAWLRQDSRLTPFILPPLLSVGCRPLGWTALLSLKALFWAICTFSWAWMIAWSPPGYQINVLFINWLIEILFLNSRRLS